MVYLRHILALVGLLLLLALAGCGKSGSVSRTEAPDNTFEGARVGTDATLEVATWNLENFAKNGTTTIDYVVEAVQAMDADIVALQEISSRTEFNQLAASLEGWTAFQATSHSSINLGYLYRTGGGLEVDAIYEILVGLRPLNRRPLVLEGKLYGEPFVVINNHYWCCGDGYIDEGNYDDREFLRQQASLLLDEFIQDNLAGQNVIMVGDLNDLLIDSPSRNVFQNFLDQPELYRFVDLPIAEGPSYAWSFPGYPSHLDHILITAPLFEAAGKAEAMVKVVPLHTYLKQGFRDYDDDISDHLPVVLRLTP